MSADHRAKLEGFLRAAKQAADGRWFVEAKYDFSTTKNPACKAKGIGRIYGDTTLGTLPTDIRNYIVTDCADVDISNSHPTCLLHACTQAGFHGQAPCLAEYVHERSRVHAELQADYGLSTRQEQKQALIAVLNGGTPPTCIATGSRRFLYLLAQETKVISRVLMADPRYAEEAAAANKLKGRVTFLHYLMSKIEMDVLISIAAYLQGCNRTVRCLIYDGLLVQLLPGETQHGLDASLLSGAEAHVLAETGCSITLASKPMQSCYTDRLKNLPRCLVDDDHAAGRFVSLYGKEHLMYIHIYTYMCTEGCTFSAS